LTRYPDLKAIRDLGNLLQSPWKKKFFRLLSKERNLDDPRIRFAVVCASVGCPMLRNEAYVADRLDAQLDDAIRRFLSIAHATTGRLTTPGRSSPSRALGRAQFTKRSFQHSRFPALRSWQSRHCVKSLFAACTGEHGDPETTFFS
jgi:hypothetical protein